MKMCVGGKWIETNEKIEVLNPYDNSVVERCRTPVPGTLKRALAWRCAGRNHGEAHGVGTLIRS